MNSKASQIIKTLFLMVGMQAIQVNAQSNLETIKERFAKRESENLSKPYEGIVTSKGIEKGLFSVHSTEASSDNKTIDYQGLVATKITEEQKMKLFDLINQYISNMEAGHARVTMEDIKKHLDNTWFSWIGKLDKDAVFYYRIHSPVILIEFDHLPPVGIEGQGHEATRNHIHSIVRTPNGNDYGKDLLRQHLLEHHSNK